jgi:hypothetical protein
MVIAEGDKFKGYTGKVLSILENKTEKNIVVDIDVDGTCPVPYYYSESELKAL